MLVVLVVAFVMTLPAIIATKTSACRAFSHCAFVAACCYIAIFLMCVAFPYYFQGYAERPVLPHAEPLGLTSVFPVNLIAYFLTFRVVGFAWLSVSICLVAIGRASDRRLIDGAAKVALILLAALLLTDLGRFEATINMTLE